jgi:dipeptidyl aminopeptidase/acylaminoacyl peptidase
MLLLMALGASAKAVASDTPTIPHPFTLDDMLRIEGMGETVFDPTGARLVLEKFAPYEEKRDFSLERVFDKDRSTLLALTLRAGQGLQPMSTRSQPAYWYEGYSPQGTRIAVGWFGNGQMRAGVYEMASGAVRTFDFLPSVFAQFSFPLWVSEHEIIYRVVEPGQQHRELHDVAHTQELTASWARRSWAGKEPAVQVIGSGAYQTNELPLAVRLIKVDLRDGKQLSLGEGVFSDRNPAAHRVLSADGRYLAAVRTTGYQRMGAATRIREVVNQNDISRLELFDLRSGERRTVCPDCNVVPDSAVWSPSGRKLFFAARDYKRDELVGEYFIYEALTRKLQRVAPAGIEIQLVDQSGTATQSAPMAWLSEVPVIRGRKIADGERARQDWYALPARGKPVNLTRDFATPPEDYLVSRGGKLYFMSEGELWRVSAGGERGNLTSSIAEPLKPWCALHAYWRDGSGGTFPCGGFKVNMFSFGVDRNALRQGWVTFQALQDERPAGVLFLNVETGVTVRLASTAPDDQLLAASAIAKAAVFRRTSQDGTHVSLSQPGKPQIELLHYNRHLQAVSRAEAVALRRKDAKGKEWIDWVLLPPGHEAGRRYPLIVNFYPGAIHTLQRRVLGTRIDEMVFLNEQLFAGHGYAVLTPSVELPPAGTPSDPMLMMHDQLIAAAENAVAAGYADPERWALTGHSYGGYGTLSVLTQTRRFKAAIAMDGMYNLLSAYAAMIPATKAFEVNAAVPFGVLWSEGGQGRMGSAPWADAERYVRNSPFAHADDIHTPVMLVHGDADFVEVQQAEQMFNALLRLGRDAQLVRYWGEGHLIHSPANTRDLWRRIFDWYDRYLKP